MHWTPTKLNIKISAIRYIGNQTTVTCYIGNQTNVLISDTTTKQSDRISCTSKYYIIHISSIAHLPPASSLYSGHFYPADHVHLFHCQRGNVSEFLYWTRHSVTPFLKSCQLICLFFLLFPLSMFHPLTSCNFYHCVGQAVSLHTLSEYNGKRDRLCDPKFP